MPNYTGVATDESIDAVARAALGVRQPTTLRQVATNCLIPHQASANTNKQFMIRSAHVMRAVGGVSALKVVLPNFYCTTSGATGGLETAPGGAATWTAAIEYPVGVYTQAKFSGSVSGTAPDGGMVTSDWINVSIPCGALFYVRGYFVSNTGGIVFYQNGSGAVNAGIGEAAAYGASGIADVTMGGAIASSDLITMVRPVAIIGMSSTPAPMIVGDSRASGVYDTPNAGVGLAAYERVIGASLPVLNLSTGGATAAGFIAGHANRLALGAYATSGIMQMGANDILGPGGASVATLQANLATIKGYYPASVPWWLTTKEPFGVTSTDSWVTLANQTLGTTEALRTSFNTWARTAPAGYSGYLEVTDAIESARNSGKWKIIDGAASTGDGIHANLAGYLEQVRSQTVNPALFT